MRRGLLVGLIAGGVVLVLLWYFVLFAPTSSDLDDTRSQVAQAQSQRQQLEDAVRRLKELSSNAAQQQATLRTLRAAVPPTPDLASFILQANDIATAAGIDWLSISPTPPAANAAGGPPTVVALSMQVDGGFFEVLDYLNRLEGMERLVLVDTINITSGGAAGTGATGSSGSTGATSASSSDTSGGAPDLSVTLSGRMFTSAPPSATAGATPGAATPTTPGATTPTTTPGSTTPTTPPASSSGSSS